MEVVIGEKVPVSELESGDICEVIASGTNERIWCVTRGDGVLVNVLTGADVPIAPAHVVDRLPNAKFYPYGV